jgi:rRNA-processing protein FCF1
MKLVIDTSALVSIETVNLVSRVLKYFDIIITEIVRQELLELSQYHDDHGKSSKRILGMINKDQIKIITIGDYSRHLTEVDIGEASCLELAICEKADYLITDDCNCFWYLSSNFKNTVFSIFLVRLLSNLREITHEEGWEYIERIREKRTWGNNLIYRKAKEIWKKK